MMQHSCLIVSTCLVAAVFAGGPVQGQTVIVESGDTLSAIAERTLGDARQWRMICKLNNAVLRDCDTITIGAELKLPSVVGSDADVVHPAGAQAAPVEANRQRVDSNKADNLINVTEFTSPYWMGYYVLPPITSNVADPKGGMAATRFGTADAPESGGGAASGILRRQLTSPGTYDVSVWLRSTSGPIKIAFGISDRFMAAAVEIEEEWQQVEATLTVNEEVDRLFQVVERTANNPAWEMFQPIVTKR